MSRSLSYLRRGLLGIAFVGSLSFGVTQALATPPKVARGYCDPAYCDFGCYQNTGTHGACYGDLCWCGF